MKVRKLLTSRDGGDSYIEGIWRGHRPNIEWPHRDKGKIVLCQWLMRWRRDSSAWRVRDVACKSHVNVFLSLGTYYLLSLGFIIWSWCSSYRWGSLEIGKHKFKNAWYGRGRANEQCQDKFEPIRYGLSSIWIRKSHIPCGNVKIRVWESPQRDNGMCTDHHLYIYKSSSIQNLRFLSTLILSRGLDANCYLREDVADPDFG